MKDLCGVCKTFADIVWHEDGTDRPYCRSCLDRLPLSSDEWALILLTAPWSPVGPPFKAGDVVHCRTSQGVYEGVGVVREIDIAFAHGGTPIYPTWRVEITDKADPSVPDERWYTENFLALASPAPATATEAAGD